MEFIALAIGSGDAFLLKDDGRIILFDSGGNKTKIVQALKANNVNHIHLAICSHNDQDHANGFIGLLKSKISVKEIWLPGIWSNIMQYLSDNSKEIDAIRRFGATQSVKFDNNEIDYDSLFSEESVSLEYFDDTIPHIDNRLQNVSLFADMTMRHEKRHTCYQCVHKDQCGFSVKINLKRIKEIVQLAYKKGCTIRWFEPITFCATNVIDYGFVALNSRQICRIRKIKNTMSFLQALTLSEENKYSLVFEYMKNGVPVVRFSADSDCTCQSGSPYKNSIIITAPHHGSEANAIVYATFKGDTKIWVRSDGTSRKRPCAEFKKLANKYCLACHINKSKEELCFHYDSSTNKWIHKRGRYCNC